MLVEIEDENWNPWKVLDDGDVYKQPYRPMMYGTISWVTTPQGVNFMRLHVDIVGDEALFGDDSTTYYYF